MVEKFFTLESFPSEVSDRIELPNIAELILSPFFRNADIHDVYKYGGEHLKKLVLEAPLKNDKKYVLVDYYVQLLSPGFRAVYNKLGNETEWHIDGDGAPFMNSERIHLMLSECSTMTEFNTNPTKIPLDEIMDCSYLEFGCYLNDNKDYLCLNGQKMEPSKFITFSNHVHRGIDPKCNEFRMFFRLSESSTRIPSKIDISAINNTYIYRKEKAITTYKNIEKQNDKIILNIKPYNFY